MDSCVALKIGTLQLFVCAVVVLLVGSTCFAAQPVELREAPTLTKDRHAVIAITCPYAPYFGIGNGHGSEWELIAGALKAAGREAQHLYVSYEEGVRYTESDFIAGVWVCGGMATPKNGFFSSVPLLQRNFVVAVRQPSELSIDSLESLATLSVAIHPDVYRVLQPQLGPLLAATPENGLRKIANHTLLASLLTTEQLDAVITERSVFEESLKRVPKAATPTQPPAYYGLFEPVSPRILFKDRDLRDAFDKAWRESVNPGAKQRLGARPREWKR